MDPLTIGSGGAGGFIAALLTRLLYNSPHVTKDACKICHESTLKEITLLREDVAEIKEDVKKLLMQER